MKLLRRRDSEALITGRPIGNDTPFGEVETFLNSMRLEAAATAAPAPRPRLAATLDGRRPLPPAADHAPMPGVATGRSRNRLQPRPLAALAAMGVVLFGGLAGAGALPAPVQRVSANLGSHLGIHLPGATRAPARPARVDPGGGSTGAPRAPISHPDANTTSTATSTTTKRAEPTIPSTTLPATPTVRSTLTVPISIPSSTLGSLPAHLPEVPQPTLPTTPRSLLPADPTPEKRGP